MAWTVDDVRTSQGGRPVREFLDGLSTAARAKVYAAIEMLATEGNRLRMPRALLLHAFVKRTEQTPQRDLELARERQPKSGERKR